MAVLWESDNIKKHVNNILVTLDGLPINFAKHVLDEAEKELMTRAIIQISGCPQKASSAILDRTAFRQSQPR